MRRAVAAAALVVVLASCSVRETAPTEVSCDTDFRSLQLLMTQAVPTATLIPCVDALSQGWTYGGADVRSGVARFWLDSDRAGFHSVEVVLEPACSVDGLSEFTETSDEFGVRAYIRWVDVERYQVDRVFVFDGGCVTYRYRFGGVERAAAVAAEVDRSLTFLSRSAFVEGVRDGLGATLCGAGAPPCVGED